MRTSSVHPLPMSRPRPPLASSVALLTTLALAAAGCQSAQVRKAPVVPRAASPEAAPPPQVSAPERPPAPAFEEGEAAFRRGEFAHAVEAFRSALRQHPDDVHAQFNLGLAYEKLGDAHKAQAAYASALLLDPAHVPSLLNLGRLDQADQRLDAAIALYERALKVPGHEFDPALLNNLSISYRLAKQFGPAEAAARKALQRSSGDAEAYKNLGLVYYDEGNYRLAEFITGAALKLNDKDPGAHNNLGRVYLKLEDRPRALAEFQKAVALDPAFAPGLMNLGAMALAYRDYGHAEQSFARAVALEPGSPDGHLSYAYALEGQKARDPKKALAAGSEFEKVLALRPGASEALCGAAWSYAADKSGWDKAVPLLQRCEVAQAGNAAEKKRIVAKLQSIEALRKSQAAAAAVPTAAAKVPPGASPPPLLGAVPAQPVREGANPAANPVSPGGKHE